MAKFRARVSTAGAFGTGTWDKVSITIMETQSTTPAPDHLGKGFTAGAPECFFPGMPRCPDAGNLKELDPNLRYAVTKKVNKKFCLLFP